jgi:hypothetical protein
MSDGYRGKNLTGHPNPLAPNCEGACLDTDARACLKAQAADYMIPIAELRPDAVCPCRCHTADRPPEGTT